MTRIYASADQRGYGGAGGALHQAAGDHSRGHCATQAVEAGLALPLAGGTRCVHRAELIEGKPGESKSVLARAATLQAMEEPAIAAWLDALSAPRSAFAGVPMDRPRLMGILNVTPDSFSDGGDFAGTDEAVRRARQLVDDGADFVDVGGESTRPGSDPVSLEDERARVMPVIEALADLPAPISIDTRKAAIMGEAAAKGAKVINDVSALTHDPQALSAAAATGLPVVLMHALGDPKTMQDDPRYDDVLLEVFDFLHARVDAAIAAGIPRERIAVDPGIGFGKTLEHNLSLLNGLSLFHGLGVPVLVGASRKRFIGTLAASRRQSSACPAASRRRSSPPPRACSFCVCTTSAKPGRRCRCGDRRLCAARR